MPLLGQLSRFSVVGVLNTGVDLAVLNAETLLTGVTEGAGYAVQKAVSFCVAVTVSYFLNKRWTFEDRSVTEQRKKLAQFFGISVMGALINVSAATAVVTYVKAMVIPLTSGDLLTDQLWVNIGALCGTGAGLLWNFLGYKYVVFKSRGMVSSASQAGGGHSDE
jgi:putative flippase GtrA